MEKSDQPRNLIGFLFALSIAFWARDMTGYYESGPFKSAPSKPASVVTTPLSLPGSATASNKDALEIAENNNKGVILQKRGKLEEAIGAYDKALEEVEKISADDKAIEGVKKIDTDDEAIKHNSSVVYYNRGLAFQAQAHLTGVADKKQEKLKSAIKEFDKAIKGKPDFAEAHYNKGLASAGNKPAAAIVSYEKAIAQKPDFAEAHNKLGVLYREDGELNKAIESHKEAITHRPDYAEAYDNLFIALEEQGKLIQAIASYPRVIWTLTIIAGLVFLGDIVCIMWWYTKYIYKIQITATFLTFSLDFGIVAMFNTGAIKWTDPKIFLLAVFTASLLLIWRFATLYRSHEANDTDRRILSAAGFWLLIAALTSLAFLGLLNVLLPNDIQPLLKSAFLHPVLVIALSAIGIWLTFKFRERILVSSEIHESGGQRYKPMELYWPSKLADDAESKHLITDETRQGLERFRGLFRGEPGELEHDRLQSRVHPEGDLRVQSYILAMPSWLPDKDTKVKTNEVKSKAFMVGVSHWIDDLVDGRGELDIYNKLKKQQDLGLAIERSEQIFERVYKSIIVNHTNSKFYAKLLEHIRDSAPLADNRRYLFFSLNRVAVGAAIFGPKVKERHRRAILESHNATLVNMVKNEQRGENSSWYQQMLNLLVHMRAEPSGLGKVLLGLTTKTVQEMAMASESDDFRFAHSVLYSLLYAPLLYFHDVDGELACSEIVPLEMFDVNYDAIFPWLLEMRGLIKSKDAPVDERKDSRLEQLTMAFRCFAPKLPELARDDMAEIYDPHAEKAQVIPLARRRRRRRNQARREQKPEHVS